MTVTNSGTSDIKKRKPLGGSVISVEPYRKGDPAFDNLDEIPQYAEPAVPTWSDFTQNTTFHGIKYVFGPQASMSRRVLWLLCVLGAMSLFIVQVAERFKAYFNYETNVDQQLVYVPSIDFPVVTICNQNNYRLTRTYSRNMYTFIDKYYSSSDTSAIDPSDYNVDRYETEEFYVDVSHQIGDFIDSCLWNGQPCNIATDFVLAHTDVGVCYMFNAKGDMHRTTEEGSASGLTLVLNLEQYEYMKGPQNDAGVKILLHDRGEAPMMRDMGFAAAPGTHTLVAIDMTDVSTMEPPYGTCSSTASHMSTCKLLCKAEHVNQTCGCVEPYMQTLGADPLPVCSMSSMFSCVQEALAMYPTSQKAEECTCTTPCEQKKFTPSLSFAQLSKVNIERLVLQDSGRKELVTRQFEQATETLQRAKTEIKTEDAAMLSAVFSCFDSTGGNLTSANQRLQNFTTYSSLLQVVDFYGNGEGDYFDDLGSYLEDILEDQKGHAEDIGEIEAEVDDGLGGIVESFWEDFSYYIDDSPINVLQNCENTSMICVKKSGFRQTADDFFEILRSLEPITDTIMDLQDHMLPINEFLPESFDIGSEYKAKCETLVNWYKEENINETVSLLMEKIGTLNNLGHEISFQNEQSFDNEMQEGPDTGRSEPSQGGGQSENSDRNMDDKYDEAKIALLEVGEIVNMTYVRELIRELQMVREERDSGSEEYLDYCTAEVPDMDLLQCKCYGLTVKATLKDLKKEFQEISKEGSSAYQRSTLYFANVQEQLTEMNAYFADEITTDVYMAEEYNNTIRTKKSLMESFAYNITVSSNMDSFLSQSVSLKSKITGFLANIKCEKQYMLDILNLAFESELPLIHSDNYNITEFGKLIEGLKAHGSHYSEEFLGFANNFNAKYINIVEEQYDTLSMDFENNMNSVTEISKLLVSKMSDLKDYLSDYRSEIKMNSAFYLDNFVQIDIFYPELSYTQIKQQKAFELLSLISEVGGFLGLLLGASILTVCELVDYIFILTTRKCKKKKATSPTSSQTALY